MTGNATLAAIQQALFHPALKGETMTQSIAIQHLRQIIDEARKEDENGVIINFPNGKLAFDMLSLDDFILNHIGGWSKVRAIIAFGSAVKKELWAKARKRFLIFRWYGKAHVNRPRDFDFFIVLKDGSITVDWNRKFDAIERVYVPNGYGGWWDSRLKKGVLDVIEGTVDEFDEKHKNGDSVCENILRMGVLIAGEFPHPLRLPEWEVRYKRCTVPVPT